MNGGDDGGANALGGEEPGGVDQRDGVARSEKGKEDDVKVASAGHLGGLCFLRRHDSLQFPQLRFREQNLFYIY